MEQVDEKTGALQAAAVKSHRQNRGKVQTGMKVKIEQASDWLQWHQPGVSGVALEIYHQPEQVLELTNRGNTIALISDGSQLSGLGDVGAEAVLPWLESQALMYRYLAGIDAVSLALNSRKVDEIVRLAQLAQPNFSLLQIEAVTRPKVYELYDALQQETSLPVWQAERFSSAMAVLAGLVNAAELVGKDLASMKIAVMGAGLAGTEIVHFLADGGCSIGNIVVCDRSGTLHREREDLQHSDPVKWQLCLHTNEDQLVGNVGKALNGADVFISIAHSGPDVVHPSWITNMAQDAIVFALGEPIPEIWPKQARDAGAKIVATSRLDLPNYLSGRLSGPAVLRGALNVGVSEINREMLVDTALLLAEYSHSTGFNEQQLLPDLDDQQSVAYQAARLGSVAIKQGMAREKFREETLYDMARQQIRAAREREKVRGKR